MKKIIALIAILSICIILCACSNKCVEAEKADELHPQIEAFFKALNYWKNSIGSFRFQGECEAFIILSDVSAAKVTRFERNVESIY